MMLCKNDDFIFYFNDKDDSYSLVYYEGAEKKVSIPKYINSFPVTKIEKSVFEENNNIKSVIIPGSVKVIGENAFAKCKNLTNVVFSEGLKEIKSSAFYNTNLNEVVFPESLVSIGDHAFSKCNNLSKVTFSDGLESIGAYAFSLCWRIESISLPDSLKNIGARAFFSCNNIKTVNISDKMECHYEMGFLDLCDKISDNESLEEKIRRTEIYKINYPCHDNRDNDDCCL